MAMRSIAGLSRAFILAWSACTVSAAFIPTSQSAAWIGNGLLMPLGRFSHYCREKALSPPRRTAVLLGRGLLSLRASSDDVEKDSNTTSAYKVNIVGACVVRDGSVLMVERRQRSRGYWEFPGGKVEQGEDDAAALVRELKEELNVAGRLISTEPIATGEDGPVKLTCYMVDMDGDPRPADAQTLSLRWIALKDLQLKPLAVPPMDRAVLDALLAREGPKWGLA